MSITTRPFGQTAQGETVTQYILTNKTGATVKLIDYGANLTSLTVPDREGKLADVVILDQDLLAYPAERVQDVKVRCTLVGGEIVYTRE